MPRGCRLLAAMLALATCGAFAQPSIVGGWYTGDTRTSQSSVLIFLPEGAYVHIVGVDLQFGSAARSDGLERGTYAFDAASGAFSVATLLDADGARGLGALSGVAGVRAELAGDTLTFDLPGGRVLTFNRVAGIESLVGAWGGVSDGFALAMLADGTYFYYLAWDGAFLNARQPVVRHANYALTAFGAEFFDIRFWEVRRRADGSFLLFMDYYFELDLRRIGPFWAPPARADGYTVVEFHHAGFQHHFVTASPDEIGALDRGEVPGWARTGLAFGTTQPWDYGLGSPVCRFLGGFVKVTHFYTTSEAECSALKRDPAWRYEGEAFELYPTDPWGACFGAATPLYRLYNNGRGGVPNHRYTASRTVRDTMLARGYVAEGLGELGVIGCVLRW